jgi:hypothetical protein
VRHGNSTSYEDLGDIHSGERYVGFEIEGNWTHFWYDHRNLWCHSGYIVNVTEQDFFKVVSSEKVNVMDAPSSSAGFIDYVYSGQKFCMLEMLYNESQDWVKFNYKGTEGWIPAEKVMFFDYMAPQYANLTQIPVPAELGENVTLKINVTDALGVSLVVLEYDSTNHTMEWIGNNTYQWSNWIPQAFPAYYRIFMKDYSNNWNTTPILSLNLQDSQPPYYTNLIESADPLQLGTSETIQIEVSDTGMGVDEVFLEYDVANHTMTNVGGMLYQWALWQPNSTGTKDYKIFMSDNAGNWNYTTGNITVISTTGPNWSNLVENSDPLEFGMNFTVYINVTDLQTAVTSVLIEYENQNHTMINISSTTFYHSNWIPSSVGSQPYSIFMVDTENNWNSLNEMLLVHDTTAPTYINIQANPSPLELGEVITVQLEARDLPGTGISEVLISYNNVNFSMNTLDGVHYNYTWIPTTLDSISYRIYLQDNEDNWNITQLNSITVQDTRPPACIKITQYPTVVEVGDVVILRVEITDLGGIGIQSVFLEYGGINHTMIKTTGDYYIWDNWEVDDFTNITYRIFMADQNDNWNVTSSYELGVPGGGIKPFNYWWIILGIVITATLFLLRNRGVKKQAKPLKGGRVGKAAFIDPLETLQEVKQDWRQFLGKYLDDSKKPITISTALLPQLSSETIEVLKEEQNKAILDATRAIDNEDIQLAITQLEKAAKFAKDLGDSEKARLVLTKIKEMKRVLADLEARKP